MPLSLPDPPAGDPPAAEALRAAETPRAAPRAAPRVAFLLNPAAGNGAAARRRPALAAAIRAAGLDAEIHVSASADDVEPLARRLAGTAEAVVAVGGDGTIHGVANALAGTATLFGALPLGTGNDFARALGMPFRLDAGVRALADALAAGSVRTLDAAVATWDDARGARRCVVTNAVGAGFDAAAAADASRYKALGGRAAYLVAVVRGLWAWRQPGVEVEVSVSDAAHGAEPAGERVVFRGALFLVEVGNGQAVGGGFRLTPDARLDDGLLDVCVVRHARPRRVLRILPMVFSGGHVRFPEVGMHRAASVTVRATRGTLPVHADGEAASAAATVLRVAVWPGALRVLVPVTP